VLTAVHAPLQHCCHFVYAEFLRCNRKQKCATSIDKHIGFLYVQGRLYMFLWRSLRQLQSGDFVENGGRAPQ
jgi:hypothetical protein